MDIRGKKISELMLWAVGKAKEKCYITAEYQDGNFIMEAAGDKANLFALGCGIVKELAKADKDYETR